jgi:uncharacterized protein YigE (DUF2233 family)
MKKIVTLLCLWTLALAAQGAAPRFTVVSVDVKRERLALFLDDEAGQPFKSFTRLQAYLAGRGTALALAVNAGMYHADFRPVGLLVQQGREVAPLNLDEGVGNFFMKPNGVFLVSAAGPQVVESSEYRGLKGPVTLATQSGPLLLRHGVMHPAFRAGSTSRHMRNGVGVKDGKVLLVMSEVPVTFFELAAYFRDVLKCGDALYLDGSVSGMYSERLGRNDAGAALGPMLGVVRRRR